jgi:hypothetical protein
MKARVRGFAKDDVADVLALRRQCVGSTEHESQDALARYFTELFFGHPWYDEALPSLVAEDEEHRIVGFLGVIPRPMTLDGTPICVATTTHFMAARSAGPLVAPALLRALFHGPQDLSIADVSSARVRQLWTSLGGAHVPGGTLAWTRVIRPAGHAAAKLARAGFMASSARAAARVIDAVAWRGLSQLRPPNRPGAGARRELTDSELLAGLRQAGEGRALRGVYDEPTLEWLLGMMTRKRWFGTLRRTRVVDAHERFMGWYVLYTRPHGTALVADIGARPGAVGTVLDHLLDETAEAGATTVSGRFDCRIGDDVAARGALILATPNGIAAHSRDREVLSRVTGESTPLSRLDGEWWMAF